MKWDNYYRKQVFIFKMSHIQLNRFSGVLKHFCGNRQKTERIFSKKFEKRQILKKGFDLMEMTFLLKPVK